MKPQLLAGLLLSFLLLAGCASTAQKGAMSIAQKAMKDGNYEKALVSLGRAERYEQPSALLLAEIAYLKGQCFEGLKQLEDAVGSYRYVAEKHPETPYGYRAKERLKALGK